MSDRITGDDFEVLSDRAGLLAEYISFLNGGLRPPVYCDDPDGGFYRYCGPGVREFCLLQLSSAVGNLSAAIHLGRGGFWSEVYILMRMVIEATTYIDWVLHCQGGSAADQERSAKYLREYFEDNQRATIAARDPQIRQRDVHKVLAKVIDEHLSEVDATASKAGELLYNTYKRFSYYVHNRYPELMDRYDGHHREFAVAGDRNRQKDTEVYGVIDTYLDTATLCALHIALRFELVGALKDHPRLKALVEFRVGDPRQ